MDIFAHGACLQRQSFLIVRGHPRIQPDAKHFRRFPSLAKNVVGSCLGKARLAAISECHPSMAAVDCFRPCDRTIILRCYCGCGAR
jgi:hypothetical protein